MGGGSQGLSGSQAYAGAEKAIGITDRIIVIATVTSLRLCMSSSSKRLGVG
jgi:hypothetical protein